jgi:hypothetical protein
MGTVIEIPLGGGIVALIDVGDAAIVTAAGPWHAKPHGCTTYAQRNMRRADGAWTTQTLHRLLTGWSYVDHKNGDGLDNRRENLRQATHGENVANARRRADNTSGYKGVHKNSRRGRPWKAGIRADGRMRHLGYYDSPIDAARAYDIAAREVFGEFARLNFPEVAQLGGES